MGCLVVQVVEGTTADLGMADRLAHHPQLVAGVDVIAIVFLVTLAALAQQLVQELDSQTNSLSDILAQILHAGGSGTLHLLCSCTSTLSNRRAASQTLMGGDESSLASQPALFDTELNTFARSRMRRA